MAHWWRSILSSFIGVNSKHHTQKHNCYNRQNQNRAIYILCLFTWVNKMVFDIFFQETQGRKSDEILLKGNFVFKVDNIFLIFISGDIYFCLFVNMGDKMFLVLLVLLANFLDLYENVKSIKDLCNLTNNLRLNPKF